MQASPSLVTDLGLPNFVVLQLLISYLFEGPHGLEVAALRVKVFVEENPKSLPGDCWLVSSPYVVLVTHNDECQGVFPVLSPVVELVAP